MAQGIVGISGIDTRAITRHLRSRGAMRCGLSSIGTGRDALLRRVLDSPSMAGADLSAEVTTPRRYTVEAIGEHRFTVAALDYGIKTMTPHRLAERGITTHVLPSTASGAEVMATGADGVFLANGPGDPATADRAVATVRELLRQRGADLRHLLRQPGARPRIRLRHVQARLRAPRHQPAGAGPPHRQGGDHRAQPRVRGACAARRARRDRVRRRRGEPRLPQR